MLSSNVADFAATEFDATQFGLGGAGLTVVAIESHDYRVLADGGFVKNFSPTFGGAMAGGPVLLTDAIFSGDAAVGNVTGTRANFNLQIPIDFDSDLLPTPGIPVLVISPPVKETDAIADRPSSLATNLPERFDDNEGGEIPIRPIIASLGPGATPHVDEPAIVRTPDDSRDIGSLSSRTASASIGGRISGEWARPMMLELAGGERTLQRQDSHATDSGDGRVRERASESPLSFDHESERSAVHLASLDSAAGSDGRDAAASAARAAVAGRLQVADLRTESSVLDGVKYFNMPARANSYSPMTSDAPDHAASDGVSDVDEQHSARAAAFGILGAEETSGARLMDQGGTWGTPLKATSLLMILALERIATGNSRRGKLAPQHAARAMPSLQHFTSRKLPRR